MTLTYTCKAKLRDTDGECGYAFDVLYDPAERSARSPALGLVIPGTPARADTDACPVCGWPVDMDDLEAMYEDEKDGEQ